MSKSLFVRWTHASLTTLQEHARLLTSLDQAIGDGDHGDNMLRGFSKLAARSDEFEPLGLGAALQMAGDNPDYEYRRRVGAALRQLLFGRG